MAANDLNTPLGQNQKKPIRKSQIFMIGSFIFLATLILALLGWVLITDDPHGGYPMQVVELNGSNNGNGTIGIEGIRPAIKPGIPDTVLPGNKQARKPLQPIAPTTNPQGQIRILDPSDPSLSKSVDAGKAAFERYARNTNSDAIAGLPKIAVIVDGLGLSQTTTQEALSLLPPDITLAFAPYGNALDRWTSRARSQGHELLLQVPMEPFDYPNNDPGPHTLLTAADSQTNLDNLEWSLKRFDSYVGIMNYMGARFTADELAATDLINALGKKGLLYVENGISGRSRMNDIADSFNLPNLRADIIIDVRGRSQDIETKLIQLESLAQEKGYAIGIATAFPVSVRTISEWTQNLRQRGFALVPITTILKQ